MKRESAAIGYATSTQCHHGKPFFLLGKAWGFMCRERVGVKVQMGNDSKRSLRDGPDHCEEVACVRRPRTHPPREIGSDHVDIFQALIHAGL